MASLFTPPAVRERPDTGNRLVDALTYVARGVTVLKAGDGSYSTVQYPSTDDLAAAAAVYVGGHSYVVDSVEAAALAAAGFGSYLQAYTAPVERTYG